MGRSGQHPAGRNTHPVVRGRRLTARQLTALRSTPSAGVSASVSEIGVPLAQLRAVEKLELVEQTSAQPARFARTAAGERALELHSRVGGSF